MNGFLKSYRFVLFSITWSDWVCFPLLKLINLEKWKVCLVHIIIFNKEFISILFWKANKCICSSCPNEDTCQLEKGGFCFTHVRIIENDYQFEQVDNHGCLPPFPDLRTLFMVSSEYFFLKLTWFF